MKSCEQCRYYPLCKGEDVCSDFDDAENYRKHTWKPGEVGYVIFAGQVHKVTVNYSALMWTEYGQHEAVNYTFYGEHLTTHVGDPAYNQLYRTRAEAEEELSKR